MGARRRCTLKVTFCFVLEGGGQGACARMSVQCTPCILLVPFRMMIITYMHRLWPVLLAARENCPLAGWAGHAVITENTQHWLQRITGFWAAWFQTAWNLNRQLTTGWITVTVKNTPRVIVMVFSAGVLECSLALSAEAAHVRVQNCVVAQGLHTFGGVCVYVPCGWWALCVVLLHAAQLVVKVHLSSAV